MEEELSGEVGRERRVGVAPSSLRVVVQSFFEQLPCRGPLVNTHLRSGAWTRTAQLSAAGRLVLRGAGAWGWDLSSAVAPQPARLCLAPCSNARVPAPAAIGRDTAGPVHTDLFFSVLMNHFYHKNKTVVAG